MNRSNPSSRTGTRLSAIPGASQRTNALRWARRVRNALEVMRLGRLGAPYRAPYDVLVTRPVYRLRRYVHPPGTAPRDGKALVLVPPLMVTSEVYDIAPEISAVGFLARRGFDVWIVDFGAPEEQEGGLARTLDDHVRAVSEAIDHVTRLTGSDIHLAGYSQGGMFAYQAAAYRASAGLASVITFGSPVDIHRNLPVRVDERLVERFVHGARRGVDVILRQVEGLPGELTSMGFKLLSLRKEVSQIADFLSKLHDRAALEQRESRRRFLGGEGFVAWPGPALRQFVDEFIVHNRMASGGFVIDGRTITLADISSPILCFIGRDDELARPASIRAIRRAAPAAVVHEVTVPAGHFGLVVGSKALATTWPTVAEWIDWRDARGPMPQHLRPPESGADLREAEETPLDDIRYNLRLVVDVFADAVRSGWDALGRASHSAGTMVDSVRWQAPRLAALRALTDDTQISVGRALADQASRIPDETFFLFEGRAFTYAQANQRVNAVVRGLVHCGVRRGDHVAIVMRSRPSYLTSIAALSRLGAVAILLGPSARSVPLQRAFSASRATFALVEPESISDVLEVFGGRVLVLGGGGEDRTLDARVVDMEAIDVADLTLPQTFVPDMGRAADLAMMIFTSGTRGEPRLARITNHRWALSALGTASSAMLTTRDTVLCALPLHYPLGILGAVSAALVGGARLALVDTFDPARFWGDVRRYGVSVVFYAGEMCRALLNTPASASDAMHPVRIFAGGGMRLDVWNRFVERFGRVGVLEYYATTEVNAFLANISGAKVGSVGRPMLSSAELALVRFDSATGEPLRSSDGDHLVRPNRGEPGRMLVRIDASNPLARFDGFLDQQETERRVLRNAFVDGDAWFDSGDILREDDDGDFWFVDRVSDQVQTAAGAVSARAVEDAIYAVPFVSLAVVYGVMFDDAEEDSSNVARVQDDAVLEHVDRCVAAAITLRDAYAFDAQWFAALLMERLSLSEMPRFLRVVSEIPVSDGFRVLRPSLVEAGLSPNHGELWYFDVERSSFRRVDGRSRRRALRMARKNS